MTQPFGSPSIEPAPPGTAGDATAAAPLAPGEPPVLPPPDFREAAAASPLPRFCNACGAPQQVEWPLCPHCAARHCAPGDPVVEKNSQVTSAIALYFAFLSSSAVAMIAMLGGADSVSVDFWVSGLVSLLVIGWCVYARRDVGPALGRVGPPVGFPIALGGAVATFALASGALWVLSKLLGVPELSMTDDFVHRGYGLPTLILMIAVQPAVIEELAFRGVIQAGLQSVLSPVESIVVSALMFMIIHLSVASFPHLFVIGLALGWLRLRTGSLYPGMLLHCTHNLLCVIFEIWRPPLPW